MTRIISVLGKDGSGKSVFCIGLALALRKLKRKVAVIELNIKNPDLSLYMGSYAAKHINDFIEGRCSMHDAIHKIDCGVDIIFASTHYDRIQSSASCSMPCIQNAVEDIFKHHNFVIIDQTCDTLNALSGTETIFVTRPHISDSYYMAIIKNDIKINYPKIKIDGVVISKTTGKSHELTGREIARFCDLQIIGSVRKSDDIEKYCNMRSLGSMKKSKVMKDFMAVAQKLDRMPTAKKV